MPIKLKPEPAGARTLLHSMLVSRVPHTRHVRALQGRVRVSGPIPVFSLAFKYAASANPLRNARPVGLSYLLIGDEATGLAHLRGTSRKLTFAGVTDGPAAKDLIEAATLAEAQLESITRAFEARILEIPSLRIHTLWLYSKARESRFVPLDHGAGTQKLQSLQDIEKRIQGAYRHLRPARTKAALKKKRSTR